jgi:hypothetical protein
MRQEVQATVRLVYDVDASLTREEIAAQILADVNRLAGWWCSSKVELMGGKVLAVAEEGEIYATDS